MSSSSPFFSIVIPTYNRCNLLAETIKSVLVQDNVDVEVIIVDDGSTDQTELMVTHFNNKRLKYFKTKNVERGAARNIGLSNSNGLFVNFFDSDDLYYPCLLAVRDFITGNNFPSVVYGDIHDLSPDGTINGDVTLPFSSFKENILYNNFLACGSVFIRRDVARDYPFSSDRKLSGSEDWELWLRLYSQFDFARVPVAIFKQRQHPNRSLLTADATLVTIRENLFAKLIDENREVLKRRFSNAEINLLMANRMTLIALVQIVGRNRNLSFQYWLRSFKLSASVLKSRRFFAVAKKLMFPSL